MKNFNTIYYFHLDAGVNFVKMLNEKVFAAVYNGNEISIGVLPHLGVPFKISQNEVLQIKKGKTSSESIIMILSNDNSVDIRSNSFSSETICIIYPPPSAALITFMHYCRGKVYLILDSGALCVYRIDMNGDLEAIYEFGKIKDANNRSIN
jgi:hypothetical protein